MNSRRNGYVVDKRRPTRVGAAVQQHAATNFAETAAATTADMLELIQHMAPEARAELDNILMAGDAPIWVPHDGPQLAAYLSEADIVFYGGAAGGGKTDLLMGVSLTTQEHSILFRREAVQLVGIEERMTKILGTRKGYNSQSGVWRLPGDRVLELGSARITERIPDRRVQHANLAIGDVRPALDG